MARTPGATNKTIRELKADRARLDDKIRYKEKLEKMKQKEAKKTK